MPRIFSATLGVLQKTVIKDSGVSGLVPVDSFHLTEDPTTESTSFDLAYLAEGIFRSRFVGRRTRIPRWKALATPQVAWVRECPFFCSRFSPSIHAAARVCRVLPNASSSRRRRSFPAWRVASQAPPKPFCRAARASRSRFFRYTWPYSLQCGFCLLMLLSKRIRFSLGLPARITPVR